MPNINKKKSWDPTRGAAQKILWQREQAALEEAKRIAEKQKERTEERRLQALQQLQDNVSGTSALQRLDWMYSAPKPEHKEVSREREEYLLGRRISNSKNVKTELSMPEVRPLKIRKLASDEAVKMEGQGVKRCDRVKKRKIEELPEDEKSLSETIDNLTAIRVGLPLRKCKQELDEL
jgi:hypothetical protein